MVRSIAPSAALLVFAGCALDDLPEAQPEPSATSHVITFAMPTPSVQPIDVLFVLDESPAMAAQHARVVASMTGFAQAFEAELAGQDLDIGVITTAPSARGHLVGGRFLHERSTVDAIERDFSGSLAAQLASLADHETSELEPNQPLDASMLAISSTTNPGFRRADARLFLVMISNRDDQSLGSLEDYRGLVVEGSTRFYLALVEQAPAPRLEAFADQFAGLEDSYGAIGDIAGPAYDTGASLFALALRPPFRSPSGCLDAPLATPHECAISDVENAVATTQLHECGATDDVPCWRLDASASCVRIAVKRAVFPAPSTWIRGQCVANFPGN